MNNQKLQNFIDLVVFDQTLVKLESLIALSKKKTATLELELHNLQLAFDKKVQEKKETKKLLDLQELDVKRLQDLEIHQAHVVQNTKNVREYDAAQTELENLKLKRDKQEQRLMQLWNLYEHLQKDLEKAHIQKEKKEQDIHTTIIQEQQQLETLQKDFDQHDKQRNQKVAIVPQEWIDLYDHMRGKVDNPVVPMTQESCSVCLYIISSRDLQNLKQGQLVQCKDCYRFLYQNDDSIKK